VSASHQKPADLPAAFALPFVPRRSKLLHPVRDFRNVVEAMARPSTPRDVNAILAATSSA
jgi:hypothetical protein